MALRDWSVGRLAIIWAAWLLLVVAGFLTALILSPDGIHVSISPPEARGVVRWIIAAIGGLALVLPPAVITYFWYLGRLRKWSERPDAAPTARDRVG